MRPSPELKKLLGRIFDSVREDGAKRKRGADYEERRFDFVFHMTDWLRDLQELSQMYAHPTGVRINKASIAMISILIHVIPHLNAAGRLLLDEISDPFAQPTRKARAKTG